MKKIFLFLCIGVEALVIISIAFANYVDKPLFYFFYNGIFGVGLSVLLPILYMRKYQEHKESVGIKHFGKRQMIVTLIFIVFSIGGQSIPLIMNKTELHWDLLSICVLPLLMTTFFEEFLFRGFIQTRIEKIFGVVPAIVISGLLFSLYHIGYPGFRDFASLLLLLAVGVGFSVAYKLSDNNLLAAYLVNLPNAILTYLLKSSQFPAFDEYTGVYAGATIVLVVVSMIIGLK